MNTKIHSLASLGTLLKAGAAPDGQRPPRKVIVFIHGILSSHETFRPLVRKLRTCGLGDDTLFAYFDYNYRESIAVSGINLGLALSGVFAGADEVTIVGHSMGGLVGRLALLLQQEDQLPFVKRLVMLGTPNHGTLHTGKMGVLMQLIRESTGKIWALMSRRTGLKELTEIDTLMGAHLDDITQRRTFGVEYVTIPATFFHEGSGAGRELLSESRHLIGGVPFVLEFLKALPGFGIGLERPHDGIVEASSVYLGGSDTRRSERMAMCGGASGGGEYCHVNHPDYRKENHVTLQGADRTAEILIGILSSPSVRAWREQYSGSCMYTFKPDCSM